MHCVRAKPKTPLFRGVVLLVAAHVCRTAAFPVGPWNWLSGRPLKILTMGDSYASGVGARDSVLELFRNYSPEPKICLRSITSWSGQYKDCISRPATLVNVACSGAVLLNKNTGDGEPMQKMSNQLKQVLPIYDLVFLTATGNDLKFATILEKCYVFRFTDVCRNLVNTAIDSVADYKVALKNFLLDIRKNARNSTKVVLVGYPFMALDNHETLTSLKPWMYADYPFADRVRQLGFQMDVMQQNAVKEANKAAKEKFAFFVNTKSLFAGHELDARSNILDFDYRQANPEGWIQDWDKITAAYFKEELFHMNAEGHRQLGKFLCGKGDWGAGKIAPQDRSDLDMVVVVDSTGSTASSIGEVKKSATGIVRSLSSSTESYRVAIVDYRDFPTRGRRLVDYSSRLVLDFTDNATRVTEALNGLTVSGGGDDAETVWSGLMMAFSLAWRPGVQKIAIQFGDAPPHDPERVTGYTKAGVIARAMELDPVAVYSIDTGHAGTLIADVSVATGGTPTVGGSSDIVGLITKAINETVSAPFAWVGTEYIGYTGDAITFDGSGSFAKVGEIVSWEWDFDGDSTYDATTDIPIVNHTYTDDFSGLVTLRVTDTNGLTSMATAPVDFSVDGDGIPAEKDNCPFVYNILQHDGNNNGVGDECDPVGPTIPYEYVLNITFAGARPYKGKAGAKIQVSFKVLDPNKQDSTPVVSEWYIQGCNVSVSSERNATVLCAKPGTYKLFLAAHTNYSFAPPIASNVSVASSGKSPKKSKTRPKPTKRSTRKRPKRVFERHGESLPALLDEWGR